MEFGQPNVRDAAYVRLKYEDEGKLVGNIGCTNHPLIFEDCRRLYTQPNLDLIKVTRVVVTGEHARATRGGG